MVVAEDSEVATAVVDFGDAVVAMLRTKGEAKLSDKPGVQRSVLSVSLCLSNTFLKHLSQTHGFWLWSWGTAIGMYNKRLHSSNGLACNRSGYS